MCRFDHAVFGARMTAIMEVGVDGFAIEEDWSKWTQGVGMWL